MDRERLADASFEGMLRVADRYGVDVPDNATPDELALLVHEAAEETREEHRRTNNHSVRIEETKYDNRAEAAELPGDDEDIELPESYNETRIVLLLRDPVWAFAYWDLCTAYREDFQRSDNFEGLLLRVYSLETPNQRVGNCKTSFDIPVALSDNRRYINLPERKSHYRLCLIAVEHETERALALSNVVTAPRVSLSNASRHAGDESGGDELLAQTGIQELDQPVNGNRIPQRLHDIIGEDIVSK